MKKGDKIGLNERYVVGEHIGSGTYGDVWNAYDTQMRREVAIKIMREGKNAIQRLTAEAVLGGLSYKNIVQIYDYSADEGFMVMECVKGKSLEKLLRECIINGTWLDRGRILQIIEQLLEGLEYAHENKRIHGDIKPGNILVPDRGEIKIADFGVATVLSQSTGMPVSSFGNEDVEGSGSYAAPEIQEVGRRMASVQSDLFSAGIVTYLLFTKRHPFIHQSGLFKIPELIKRKDYELTPPCQVECKEEEKIPEFCDSLILKLLKYNPEDRCKSATEVLEVVRPKPRVFPCPNCAYENSIEAVYCSKCGTKLVAEETSLGSLDKVILEAQTMFFVDQKPMEAETLLRKNLAAFKKQKKAEAFSLLGFILNNTRKYGEAKKYAQESQKMNPDRVESYRVTSFAASQLGQYDEAIEQLGKAFEKADNNYIKADVLYQRGRTYQMMGDFFSACNDAKKALEYNPLHAKARRLRDTVCV